MKRKRELLQLRIAYFTPVTSPSSLSKLTSLTDLNLSGNNLQALPQAALSSMENLQVLSVHSNRLCSIPDLRRLKSLKVRSSELSERIVHDRFCLGARFELQFH